MGKLLVFAQDADAAFNKSSALRTYGEFGGGNFLAVRTDEGMVIFKQDPVFAPIKIIRGG